jgi:hypothetical protein
MTAHQISAYSLTFFHSNQHAGPVTLMEVILNSEPVEAQQILRQSGEFRSQLYARCLTALNLQLQLKAACGGVM